MASVNAKESKLKAHEITADKGEKEIAGDAESMYSFSAFVAANAAG